MAAISSSGYEIFRSSGANSAVKGLPRPVRRIGTLDGWSLAAIDQQILLEEIGLGNIRAASLAQDAGKLAKRMRPAANGFSGAAGYLTHGICDSPLQSEEGRLLIAAYRSQGIAPDRALKISRELMASGSTLPKAVELAVGASLFKIVPEGDMPAPYSAFFATKDEVTAMKGMSYDQIADCIGIPLESQQTL